MSSALTSQWPVEAAVPPDVPVVTA